MGLCLYVDLCFHASSLPCLHTFWHAIPTSSYIFNVFYFLVSILFDVNLKIDVNLMQLELDLRRVFFQVYNTTSELETALIV